MHFANATAPAVPEALADVIEGFLGLDDFRPQSQSRLVPPDYNTGGQHFLVPEDFATIYNIAPLYAAGIDGTGQSIAVVGQSDIQLSDTANDPGALRDTRLINKNRRPSGATS